LIQSNKTVVWRGAVQYVRIYFSSTVFIHSFRMVVFFSYFVSFPLLSVFARHNVWQTFGTPFLLLVFILGLSKSFRTELITKYTLTTINTCWEATQRVMAAKLTRQTHKITVPFAVLAPGGQSWNFWIHLRISCCLFQDAAFWSLQCCKCSSDFSGRIFSIVSNEYTLVPLPESIFSTVASRTALGPTQPHIQWVSGSLSLGVKRPGREADHSLPSSAEVKERVELYLHSPNTPSWRVA
jgi:hypothetical protein